MSAWTNKNRRGHEHLTLDHVAEIVVSEKWKGTPKEDRPCFAAVRYPAERKSGFKKAGDWKHNGLVLCDFDHLSADDAQRARDILGSTPGVVLSELSPSREGAKPLVAVKPVPGTHHEHEQAWEAANEHCEEACRKAGLDIRANRDKTGKDAGRIAFFPDDAHAVYRPEEAANGVAWSRHDAANAAYIDAKLGGATRERAKERAAEAISDEERRREFVESGEADRQADSADTYLLSEVEAAPVFANLLRDRFAWTPGFGWMRKVRGGLWERDEGESVVSEVRGMCEPTKFLSVKASSVHAVARLMRAEMVVPADAWDGSPDVAGRPDARWRRHKNRSRVDRRVGWRRQPMGDPGLRLKTPAREEQIVTTTTHMHDGGEPVSPEGGNDGHKAKPANKPKHMTLPRILERILDVWFKIPLNKPVWVRCSLIAVHCIGIALACSPVVISFILTHDQRVALAEWLLALW